MAKKPIINPVSPGNNAAAINANLYRIQEAFDNTVSRDGSTPNHMLADFDMNSNDILNAGVVQTDQLLVRGVDFEDYIEDARNSADRAESEADRAEYEADRAALMASIAENYADQVERAATQEQTTFLTVEGQTLYTHDSEGKEFNLAPSGCDLFGPSRDILVRGVDYEITPEGHILLAYEPDGYDLYVVNFLQRYTNDDVQQVILGVEEDADRAEAAADRAAQYGGPRFDKLSDLLASTSTYADWTDATTIRVDTGSLVFSIAPQSATDQHHVTAGGVKLYEAGPFTSVRRFEQAVARGQLWQNGSEVVVSGRVFVFDGGTAIPTLPGWREHTVALPDGWQLWDLQDESVKIRTDVSGTLWGDVFAITPSQLISDIWEPIRLAHPDYVTRSLLGKDESGLHDIWRYDFTPSGYEKTLVITGVTHGGEVSAALAAARVMWLVANEWFKYPQLAYLRHRVRIVVVPCVNPWGMAQSPRRRQNSNGVDLNRNADYRWDEYPLKAPFDHDYKGTAPWSEVEARYVRDVLASVPKASGYLDFHNFGGNPDSRNDTAPIYLTAEFSNAATMVHKVQELCRESAWEAASIRSEYNPSLYNWATSHHGILSCNPEWTDSEVWGSPSYNNKSFRRQVKFFGNLMIGYARAQLNAPHIKRSEKKRWFAYWTDLPGVNDPVLFTNTAPTTMSFLTTLLSGITSPGIVTVNGAAMFSGSEPMQIIAAPRLYQFGARKWGALNTNNTQWNESTKAAQFENFGYISGVDDRLVIPLIGAFPVYPEVAGSVGVPSVGLWAHVTTGTGRLRRYRMMIEYEPTDTADESFTIFNANGRETEGSGAMQQEWPKN